jgi:pimeloyl-ACP methyl ester carboxylesterase
VTHSLGAVSGAVERPDGAEIHWQARGEGPCVLVAHHTLWSHPGIYADLVADLARDHRAVLYDPRGCGRSSRRGPYDFETDAADVGALAEMLGGVAVAVAVGDGLSRVARVAPARPDLISDVVVIAPGPAAVLPRSELEGSGLMAASEAVIEVVLQMMRTDPRSALRTLIGAINPDLDENALRERVDAVADYLDAEAGVTRTTAWLEDDVSAQVQALGERFWILHGGTDPLFEGALGARVAELFPKARVEHLRDGPVSRPELTAAHVRRLTGAAAPGA